MLDLYWKKFQMKLNWLNKKNNNKLIVFFNGWGMDDTAIAHLSPEDYDVLTVCDYNTLGELPDLTNYKSTHIVAWSMGVMVATLYNCNQCSATAINGTPFPINSEYGINPKVYKLMELGYSEQTAEKFLLKMFKDPTKVFYPKREAENQKNELTALKNYSANPDFKYTRVIIGDKDKIIPTQSQKNYWGTNAEIINEGHYPFLKYSKWEELL